MTQEDRWIIYDSRLKVHGSCLGKRPEVERMMKQDERWKTLGSRLRVNGYESRDAMVDKI